jgi:hypothetical protein
MLWPARGGAGQHSSSSGQAVPALPTQLIEHRDHRQQYGLTSLNTLRHTLSSPDWHRFIWFAMHWLLNQDPSPAIVWQTFKRSSSGTNKHVLFKDGRAFVGSLEAFASELADASTW